MNLSSNAVIAESLALKGEVSQAKTLFDQILAKEPDHVYALRGRINLAIKTGAAKRAIIDAQRLVSVVPRSAQDRLLLARAYSAAGDQRQVDRTPEVPKPWRVSMPSTSSNRKPICHESSFNVTSR